MRNYIYLLLMSVLTLAACDRLKMDESSKVRIQLPSTAETSKLQSLGSVTAYGGDGSQIPSTGFSGAAPINCYIVAIGGPEDEFQRNTCSRKDGSFQVRKVGPWVGGAAPGTDLTLDVTSGKDRVVYVVGVYAPTGTCQDFKGPAGFDNMNSLPYLLGETAPTEFKAGDSVSVTVPMTFSTDKWFDGCHGPDFPEHNGSGGGNGVVPTQIGVSKEFFPAGNVVENSCQGIEVRLADAAGSRGSTSTNTTFQLTKAGSVVSFYQFICGV